jgi:SAM-dependent methyltransferase
MAISCYAAARNKLVIFDVLKPRIESIQRTKNIDITSIRILEVASGTGEHAALFASMLKNLKYQPTEPDVEMHKSINAWCESLQPEIVAYPLQLDISIPSLFKSTLPFDYCNESVDAIICINMIHISPFTCTHGLFELAKEVLQENGLLYTYGPYRVNGTMVQSNVEFDTSLKSRNSEWGVRDLEAVCLVANECGFELTEKIDMPANNLSLIFKKIKILK